MKVELEQILELLWAQKAGVSEFVIWLLIVFLLIPAMRKDHIALFAVSELMDLLEVLHQLLAIGKEIDSSSSLWAVFADFWLQGLFAFDLGAQVLVVLAIHNQRVHQLLHPHLN